MNNLPTITILGAGYVGLTSAALFATSGYTVYVVEPNKQRLEAIKQGRSFFFEEGIDAVIKSGIDNGTLIPTDSYADSVTHSHIVFSCVGTPDNPDGSSNLTYVFAAAKEAVKYLRPDGIYVQKSTVPVGTGQQIAQLFTSLNSNVAYTSNPEFLREGTAVYDTLYFDRVVVGGENTQAVRVVLDIYRQLESHRDDIAHIAGISPRPRKGTYIATDLSSAELIKVTANAFLALKISFANSIAQLADATGADIVKVMDAVGADERIGRAFLNAGRGYGGGCFPKDVSSLISSSHSLGVDTSIMEAAQGVNASMPAYILEKLTQRLGSLADKNIAVLGLAFKANTSDVRKSPGIKLANILSENSAKVTTYDPKAKDEAQNELHSDIQQHPSLSEAIRGVDAVIVATEWSEFRLFFETIDQPVEKPYILVDAVNIIDSKALRGTNIAYLGVGRS